jgi:hypothetical protein
MGKPKRRFVAKAESKKGWRIWDNKQKRWWGERYENLPERLLAELNTDKPARAGDRYPLLGPKFRGSSMSSSVLEGFLYCCYTRKPDIVSGT